jgi:Xaa-Pro dipeptidase
LKNKTIAMEYSPNNIIPAVSKVDAGTIDFIRQLGAYVVSSANLIQQYTSVWTPAQFHSHLAAADTLDSIASKTWNYIEMKLQSNQGISEYQVQQFMLNLIEEQGCMTDDPPICAVNQNSADPHYTPTQTRFSEIHKGDFILIDLWCKQKTAEAVYADIARIGVAAAQATPQQQKIFSLLKEARDVATTFIKDHYTRQIPLQGWQVDQVCRNIIQQGSYGEFFIHRTGHNIGQQVHGSGANLDNLETRDVRELIAGTCFSMEPGIYLPDQLGMRLEYDIYLDPGTYPR